MRALRTLTPTSARRLAITRQHLAGPRPSLQEGNGQRASLLGIVRDLGCLQLDPISAVARSHMLVLHSRVGQFERAQFEALMWEERQLFEYWAHAASIVLTEDYPVHAYRMRRFARGDSLWGRHAREWMAANRRLERHILVELRRRGPLLSREIQDESDEGWKSTGWTGGRNVSQMLDFLWLQGRIMVAGRAGGQKMWDLAQRCLPEWTPRERLREKEMVRRAIMKSVRALGVARPQHIKEYFIQGMYPGLEPALAELTAEGMLVEAQIAEGGLSWPGPWYLHRDDQSLAETLQAGGWEPRTELLSPFDNLICNRKRTELLFGFRFRIEIYTPVHKRVYGYYVLPILHGDRLVGRLDSKLNRAEGRLDVHALHLEPGVELPSEVRKGVAGAVRELARFVGADEISTGQAVSGDWRKLLS